MSFPYTTHCTSTFASNRVELQAENHKVKAFVQSVTAAAVGAIAGAAFILGRRSLIDLSTVSIPLLTFGLLSFKKILEPILILAAGVAGFLLFKG